MRRKIAFISLALVACVVVALAALPWWFGVVLKNAGGRFGLTFSEYRRVGYTRFVLSDVEVNRPGMEIKVSRIELGTPVVWLFKQPGDVSVAQWSVTMTETDSSSVKNPSAGWRTFRNQLDTIISVLELWLPRANTGAGEISWPEGAVQMAGAEWRKSDGVQLRAIGVKWRDETADISMRREKAGAPILVTAEAVNEKWNAVLESHAERVIGHARWHGQQLSADARFGDAGWVPREASVKASDWKLPAAHVKLAEFYDVINGQAMLGWNDGRFSMVVEADGAPLAGSQTPPLTVRVQGQGDLDQVTIDVLDVRIPGVEGRLSAPVTMGRDGRLRSGSSRFDLQVDLSRLPWLEAAGDMRGVVHIEPQETSVPRVSATLATSDATIAEWRVTSAGLQAELQWPLLSVSSATVKLAGGDELEAGGVWDFTTHALSSGRIRSRVSRETAVRWFASDIRFNSLAVDATAEGTWPGLTHTGRAKAVGMHLPQLHPLTVELEWTGAGRTLSLATLSAEAGRTRLKLRGAVAEGSASIDELSLMQAETERLRLLSPVRVQWDPSLSVSELQLKGADGAVTAQLEWGESGELKLAVENFESAWLAELVDLPGPAWSVGSLAFKGGWDRGPLQFTMSGAVAGDFKNGRRAELVVSARGDSEGVQVETLHGLMNQQTVVKASGRIPFNIHPNGKRWIHLNETAPLSFDAATEPNAIFWEQLGEYAGVMFDSPEIRLALSGTAREPVGEATLRIAKVISKGTGRLRALPELESIHARLSADRSGVGLETFTLQVAGQLIRATGRLPIDQWAQLFSDPLTLVKAKGEVRVEVPDANMAALTRYAPAYLAPTGTLQADVSVKRGGQLQGVVRLRDAASRPLGPLGSLQGIGAEVVLNGRRLELKEVRATTGGQPVTLTGTIELSETREPRLNVVLRGEKLPFVRQTGLLVRGDLDLRIVTGDDEVTRVTGATRLRNSFFLMDVRALVPSGGLRSAPGRRPPYFSVDMLPFSEWQLDVAVDGDRFLRLRTPVFNGLASAHFRLRGTLGDPRATGEAVINEGRVLLPFATFAVRQGEVRLTETNPFVPTISLIGTSRRYGYDLRMEVRGTTDKPELTFSSTPALESEQVLLMVMTGETPQNEVSYTGRERATRLGAYLGQSLLKQLGGDPEATERLSVSVGERISRQGRETYHVEYEMNPRWSLVGEYDEFDEYNLGVKWRVFSEAKEEDENASE